MSAETDGSLASFPSALHQPVLLLTSHLGNTPHQISNGIAGYKVENPNASDTDAVQALLPGTKWQMDEHGELTMQMDGECCFPVAAERFPMTAPN